MAATWLQARAGGAAAALLGAAIASGCGKDAASGSSGPEVLSEDAASDAALRWMALRAAATESGAPAAWARALSRLPEPDVEMAITRTLGDDFRWTEFAGAAGRAGPGLLLAERSVGGGTPFTVAAIAAVPSLQLFDGLEPLAAGAFPDGQLRRLVLLLDGLLRSVLAGGSLPPEEFLSVEGPPLRGGDWAPFLTAPLRDGVARTASITSFTVRARAEYALLAAVRIDWIDAPLDDATPAPPDEQDGRDCLVLYRPQSPGVGGTAWGVAWVVEIRGDE
jgi:hypothetical protein